MIYISSEFLFIKLLTTSKMFLTWLNINLGLLKLVATKLSMWAEAHAQNGCHLQRNPLPLWVIIRVGGKHLLTNDMAWCPLSHTSAAQ